MKKARQAATLLEVIIAFGLITLLLAIVTPAFLAVRERARLGRCTGNLHQIALAIRAFQRNHHGRLPVWLSDLHPRYLDSPAVFLCPSDTSQPAGSSVDARQRFIRYVDPKIKCSYLFEFNPLPWPTWFPERDFPNQPPNLTWRQVKSLSLKVHGSKVPVVRCLWHTHKLGGHQILNLAYDGTVYTHSETMSWTKVAR